MGHQPARLQIGLEQVARGTVARLMNQMSLRGVIRGTGRTTTIAGTAADCPRDPVERRVQAEHPNWRRGADFTDIATARGCVSVACVVDTLARRISRSGWTPWRRAAAVADLIDPGDRGSRYLSIRPTERLGEAGVKPSFGRGGDVSDAAPAEASHGLSTAELIYRPSWPTLAVVEPATLARVSTGST